jgi:cytochrome P450
MNSDIDIDHSDVDHGDLSHMDALFASVRRDGLVNRPPDGILRIFDPVVAAQVEAANTEALYVGDSLIDLLKPSSARARVRWSDVRAALIEQNRRLTEPRHVKALHERMRAFLLDHADREEDLTWLIGRSVAFAIVPHIIDGLAEADLRLLQIEQQARIGKFLTSEPISIRLRLANFIRLRQATRVIAREVRRRLEGRAPPREDFLQSLLPFGDRLGVHRVAYLVTTVLTAASVAPEFSACCLVYAMHRHPEWRDRIEREMAALEPQELYSLPIEKLPSTLRFIKEASRMWPFPFVVRRRAARDIKVDGVEVRKGRRYDLSSYILHHLDDYWQDPERFDPDRWLSPRKTATRGTYVPFGFAPRSCVGASVSHALLLLVCELFARSFRVEMAKGATPRLKMEGIAIPVDMIGSIRRAAAS